jgi:iron complex outermembrane receptor protein
VPPELHVAEPRLWRYPDQSRLLAIASAGTGRRATPFGTGDAEFILGVNSGKTRIESFETMGYDNVVSREHDDDRTVTARLLVDHSLGRGEWRNAFTFANVAFHEVIDGTATDYQQRLWSAASEIDYPLAGLLRVSGGLALDGSDTPKAGGKPPLDALTALGGRLGLSTVALGGRSRVHASVSRRVRFASLRELYSGALGRFEPNPDLRPEQLLGAEVGATTIVSRWQLQTVAFHHRLSDAIVRIGTDEGKFRRVNRDGVISTGLELLGGWTGDQISVNADMLVQRVRVDDPAAGGQRRPEHQPAFRAGVDVTTPLVFGVRGLGTFKYTGAQYCVHPDLQRDVRLAGQPRVDVAFDREWHPRGGTGSMMLRSVRTVLSIDNVADRNIYDQCGLPQNGRTIRLGVSLGWH